MNLQLAVTDFLHIPKLNTVDNGRYAINTTCKVASDMCSVCCIFFGAHIVHICPLVCLGPAIVAYLT